MDEEVELLTPPLFTPSGKIKSRRQAYEDGDWIATFNLWIVTADPVPSIVYQQRSPNSRWAPNLLDVTAGGHYEAGEKFTDGLREVREELGKDFKPEEVTYLGRKVYVGFNTNGTSHNNLIEIYFVEHNQALDTYVLEENEVSAICVCPITELLTCHRDKNYSFTASGITAQKKEFSINVSKASFPENWDDYHYKIAILADRYFKKDKNLVY